MGIGYGRSIRYYLYYSANPKCLFGNSKLRLPGVVTYFAGTGARGGAD